MERIPKHFGNPDHPVCAAAVAAHLFLDGAATPPVSGGECPHERMRQVYWRPPVQLIPCPQKSMNPPRLLPVARKDASCKSLHLQRALKPPQIGSFEKHSL